MLGHSDPRTTNIYAKMTAQKVKNEMRNLPGHNLATA